jgi:hypothetical protein
MAWYGMILLVTTTKFSLYFSGGCITINLTFSYYCHYLHWATGTDRSIIWCGMVWYSILSHKWASKTVLIGRQPAGMIWYSLATAARFDTHLPDLIPTCDKQSHWLMTVLFGFFGNFYSKRLEILVWVQSSWDSKWRQCIFDLQLATGIAATTHWSINIALMIFVIT